MLAHTLRDNANTRVIFPPSTRQRIRAAAVLLPLIVALAGCGEARVETFPVTGKLTLDGKVPEGAKLILHPTNVQGEPTGAAPNARVGGDGSFSVSSYKPDDGAPPGEYIVTVEWYKMTEAGVPGPNVLPKEYASPKTSPIKVTIKAVAPTTLDPIAITSAKTARGRPLAARR